MWQYFVIAILVCMAIGLIALSVWKGKQNSQNAWSNRLMPFAGFVDKDLTYYSNSDTSGTPLSQITCPTGTKVNIVGAYFQSFDPYGQCSPTPNAVVSQTCTNDSSNPICANNNSDYQNNYCNCDGDTYQNCKIRNATYYLSQKCNGEQSCEVTVDNDFFGPYPCSMDTTDANYGNLPQIPLSSDDQGDITGTTSGYYVHGIYTCDPA